MGPKAKGQSPKFRSEAAEFFDFWQFFTKRNSAVPSRWPTREGGYLNLLQFTLIRFNLVQFGSIRFAFWGARGAGRFGRFAAKKCIGWLHGLFVSLFITLSGLLQE